MYVNARDQLLGNWTEITVSVFEQRQYDAPLAGRQASEGRERQPSVAARIIWEALYNLLFFVLQSFGVTLMHRGDFPPF